METQGIGIADQPTDVAAPSDRCYTLAILTIVYVLNIADRFSISTLIEPIRKELLLSDSGVTFLTGCGRAYSRLGAAEACGLV